MRASMAGGIALGFDVALFFSAVKLTTIANATVIGACNRSSSPSRPTGFRGDHPPTRHGAGLVAIAGVVIVVLSAASDAPTDWRGDLLAVGALFAWSAYFVFAKRAKDVIAPTIHRRCRALGGDHQRPLACSSDRASPGPRSRAGAGCC